MLNRGTTVHFRTPWADLYEYKNTIAEDTTKVMIAGITAERAFR